MPFRERFDCLWCGRPHATRSPSDIEGWAQLCPDCLGRAQDNGFLKSRLRIALRERSQQAAPAADPPKAVIPPPTARPLVADSYDDWYLRRGVFSKGPLIDMPWQMELDEVTGWVDQVPLSGVIVELAAGSGWWSTLLAGKGELWIYDSDEAALESARQRLVAHGLKAHLHVRDPLVPPEKHVDAVFGAHLLGRATESSALSAQLEVVRRWLQPGGRFVFVESLTSEVDAAVADGPGGSIRPRTAAALVEALAEAGFRESELRQTSTAFVMGQAVAP